MLVAQDVYDTEDRMNTQYFGLRLLIKSLTTSMNSDIDAALTNNTNSICLQAVSSV